MTPRLLPQMAAEAIEALAHHTGRQISAHLPAEGLSPPQRLELDSYHAIMAMV